VIGPKVILRHPLATSNLPEFAPGTHFQPVLGENVNDAKRVLFLTGKLYYELVAERQKRKLEDKVALVRVEELCPFPARELQQVLGQYQNVQDIVWVQEEPQNQGAFSYIEPRLSQLLGTKV
jgi:probable 2-oxoglutarate dehydrogenase E1 component DHKTD1